jgi:hypothetical protein
MSWISKQTELPDDNKEVLCTDGKLIFLAFFTRGWEIEVKDEDHEPGQYDEDPIYGNLYLRRGWYEDSEQVKVTHWQPLPEKP